MTGNPIRPDGLAPLHLVTGLAGQDALGPVMHVMATAFDPLYGEAWTQSQARSMLAIPLTHTIIAEIPPPREDDAPGTAIGFSMSRRVGDEEELLLIAVTPEWRHFGAGSSILAKVIENARHAGVDRIFLEMRSNNPASHLYGKFGFRQIGTRKNYYKGTDSSLYDALTLALTL